METKCHCPHCHKPLEVLLDINIVATGKLPLPLPPVPEFLTLPPPRPSERQPHEVRPARPRYSNEMIYNFCAEVGIDFAKAFTSTYVNGKRRTKLYNVYGRTRDDAMALLEARFPKAEINLIVAPFRNIPSIEIIFNQKR